MIQADLLLIGGGPANIAFAVSLEESGCDEKLGNVIMLEREDSISWHKNMLIDNAVSQVSFLKDLVTLRNPTSKFSFLNYLHKNGRLEEFVNLMSFFPYRREISDYLQWVANNLTKAKVHYSKAVCSVEPIVDGNGKIEGWLVGTSDGTLYRANRLIFGAGRDASIPPVFAEVQSERLIHSSQFLSKIAHFPTASVKKVAVIGGAQSSAEVYSACLERFPTAEVSMIMRSVGLTTYGGSKFINKIYQSNYIDVFYHAPDEVKRDVLEEMHFTNYSGVSATTMESLYRFHYLQELNGENRARMIIQSELMSAHTKQDKISLVWKNKISGAATEDDFDLVILGTGYKNMMPKLLQSALSRVNVSKPEITRAYRVKLPTTRDCSLHIQGISEATHGISDTLLSVIATRAQEILVDIVESANQASLENSEYPQHGHLGRYKHPGESIFTS
ncbi:SidA/IucD/PvdA family monooxygenase [Chitinimonas lacunae]|uniref:SidA/IucD/PvdA family monooxygenase n=1 Tax=Chitinimonas lacunae TaxID=1963018 RepID=A0ABV8MUS7_9NEIS